MSTARSYPPTRSSSCTIISSVFVSEESATGLRIATARNHTEPSPNGFMESVMRQHCDMDVLDEGDQPKKLTQEQQNTEDEEARKRAIKNLINSWQERLQLISVITTFFATTEAAMLVNTKPSDHELGSNIMQASNACLLGSLIMHVYASVLSFLGAFILITRKLKEATREEMIAEGIELVNLPIAPSLIKDLERDAAVAKRGATTSTSKKNKTEGSNSLEPTVVSSNPRVEQVGLFVPHVSSHLLSRTHALCVFLTVVGFVLGIVGIMCYAWALESLAVSTFASACLGFALLGMIVVLRI